MKTKVLLLASLLLVASSSVALAKGKGPEVSSVSELVKKEIAYPEFAMDNKLTGSVNIFFGETESGPTLVAVGSNPKLRAYVEKRMEEIKDELIAAFENENSRYYRITFLYKE